MKINGQEYSYKEAKSFVVEKDSRLRKNKRETFENRIIKRKLNGDILEGTRRDIFDIASCVGVRFHNLIYNDNAEEKLRKDSLALLFLFVLILFCIIAIEFIIMV